MTDIRGGGATPRIGVTGMWSNRIHGLRFDGSAVAAAVLRSVIRAGGEPLTLFAESAAPAEERLQGLDGLLVPGGADVDPRRYGQAPIDATAPADFAAQDQFEADMMEAALRLGIPVLAICRGFQLLNVEHGGTLVQDLPADSPHRNEVHEVTLEPDSALAGALGISTLPVSSYHHQAVDRVGAGLRVVGRAPDGVVEAVEREDAELIAVQWHPEDTAAMDARQQALFDWLVDRARMRTSAEERV
ncbi:gamma-glutamyl-gamma-aminobutyrate hydrolase family protein [Leucobacter triazinivorans]|nr:gamma-glutamyl-gamma-aminobutyrate hydrolase family protein [Leucobacter triazinivorans]